MLISQSHSFSRIVAFLLFFVALSLLGASSQNPAQAKNESLNILVDASRDGGSWWSPQVPPFDPNAPHQGKDLAVYLQSLGHVVIELPRPTTITSSLLDPQDIVIRADEYGAYSASEKTVYQNYVKSGGRLLLLSSMVRPTEQDTLALSFGITFEGISRGENVVNSFADHPITKGVSTVLYGVGSGLTNYPNEATILGHLSESTYLDLNDNNMQDPGEPSAPPVMGEAKYGSGKIVFAGSTIMWERVPQHLLDNTLNWLTAPSCYQLILNKDGQGTTPTANPTHSTGCENGYFHEGESITLTDHPADGHEIDYWTGTDSAASNHLTMPASDHTVTAHYAPTCYKLTTDFTGQGSDPTASPTHSTGCESGWYHMDESITMTPHPANYYHVDYWTGTDSASSNQLTMPASSHTVTAHYVAICYKLTTNYTGQGSDPTASPTHSSGCESGWYHAGEIITMTAHPANNYHVDYWTGTDSASSNQLTVPASSHTVTAHYVPICYELTRAYTGQGSDPTASPTHSSGCESDWYHVGEAITMTPHPANNYHLDHWTGTDSSMSKHLNMPGGAHTVIAHYVEDIQCYTLTRTHTGSGDDPTASPEKSPDCGLTDQYIAGATIGLLANPSAGWQVANWSGTSDDSSTLTSNTLTMPSRNYTVKVDYELTPAPSYKILLPAILRSHSN